jgi:hypothetical protein
MKKTFARLCIHLGTVTLMCVLAKEGLGSFLSFIQKLAGFIPEGYWWLFNQTESFRKNITTMFVLMNRVKLALQWTISLARAKGVKRIRLKNNVEIGRNELFEGETASGFQRLWVRFFGSPDAGNAPRPGGRDPGPHYGTVSDGYYDNYIQAYPNAQNYAVQLQSNTSYISITNGDLALSPQTNFSIAAWICPDGTVNGAIMSKNNTYSLSGNYGGNNNDGTIRRTFNFYIQTNASQTVSVSAYTNLLIGAWVHVAGVYDYANSNLALYINGTLAATQTCHALVYTNAASVYMGANPQTGSRGYFCYYGDTRFFGSALSASEISAMNQCNQMTPYGETEWQAAQNNHPGSAVADASISVNVTNATGELDTWCNEANGQYHHSNDTRMVTFALTPSCYVGGFILTDSGGACGYFNAAQHGGTNTVNWPANDTQFDTTLTGVWTFTPTLAYTSTYHAVFTHIAEAIAISTAPITRNACDNQAMTVTLSGPTDGTKFDYSITPSVSYGATFTNGSATLSGAGNVITLYPGKVVTNYTITGKCHLHSCSDSSSSNQVTVVVPTVSVSPNPVIVATNMANSNLTFSVANNPPNSANNLVWTITPANVPNGAMFSSSPNYTNSVNIQPGSVATSYVIKAQANYYTSSGQPTNSCDTSMLYVVDIEFVHAEGDQTGQSITNGLPIFTPCSGTNAGMPIYDCPAADLHIVFGGPLSTNSADSINVTYLGSQYSLTETGTNTLCFTNSTILLSLDTAPLADTNVQEAVVAMVSATSKGITNAVYACTETTAASLVFENERYGIILSLSGLTATNIDTMNLQLTSSLAYECALIETSTNSLCFSCTGMVVRLVNNSTITTNADTIFVSISNSYDLTNTVFKLQETGAQTKVFRNYNDPIPTSMPDITVPDFLPWRITLQGVTPQILASFSMQTSVDSTNHIAFSSAGSGLISDQKYILVPASADPAQLPSGYQALHIDDTTLNWASGASPDLVANIQLVAMASPLPVKSTKAQPGAVVLQSLDFDTSFGQTLDPENFIRKPLLAMGYSVTRDYDATKAKTLSTYIKGKQVWYSMSHGAKETYGWDDVPIFHNLGFTDGQIAATNIQPLNLKYRLVIADACFSAQTSSLSKQDAKQRNDLSDFAKELAEAFGPDSAYMGWGWSLNPAAAQALSSKFVNNLKFDATLGRARTVQEAYDKFQSVYGTTDVNAQLMKIYRNTSNVIDLKNTP